ncbi:hypothetical protein ACF8Q9_08300 [Pseudomonas sp. TYF_15]|uniref:hypothetical protein n=1 Tax=Pseudomonas sp. TYF_15 TaxID=3367194 RepID=UPI00370A7411
MKDSSARLYSCSIAIAICMFFTCGLSSGAESSCLLSSNIDSGADCHANNDPVGLSKDPDILRVAELLGVPIKKIKFQGCEGGRFSTNDLSPVKNSHDYRISYPVLKGEGAAVAVSNYLSPITHELSHVLQIEQSGSIQNLRSNDRSLKSIELAADFISGIVLGQVKDMKQFSFYQQSLSLVGLYNEHDEEAHGTWEQRTTAFRRGFFLKRNRDELPIQKVDDFFQADIYGEIVSVLPNQVKVEPDKEELPDLKILSSCDEVEMLYDRIRSSSSTPIEHCRAPGSELEIGVESFVKKFYPGKLCFLEASPSPIVDGFSCFQTLDKGQYLTQMICLRPSSLSPINNHFNDGDLNESAAYMKDSSACGNGVDSSVALPTLFPMPLNAVSKFEFGYVRGLGGGAPSEGQMQHGYATVDPAMNIAGVEAIEYVSMFSGKGGVQLQEFEKVGPWMVSVESISSRFSLINKELNKTYDGKLLYDGSIIHLNRSIDGGPIFHGKAEQIQLWNNLVVSQLEREGFDEIPKSKLKTSDGTDIRASLADLARRGPYGSRANAIQAVMEMDFRAFLIKNDLPCTQGGMGAIAAYVLAPKANTQIASNYGNITLLTAAMGECGRSSSAKAYVKNLLRETSKGLVENLKGDL